MSSAMIHYGRAIYEGAEAHHCQDGKLRLWNIRSNAARMRQGCERMMMPPDVPPERLFQVRDGGPHSKNDDEENRERDSTTLPAHARRRDSPRSRRWSGRCCGPSLVRLRTNGRFWCPHGSFGRSFVPA